MLFKNSKLNIKKYVVGSLLLLLSGCSASFTYNNVGWLSSFWIDDYVDLNKQQSKTVKAVIKKTRNWHRKTQLPLYKQDLINLQQLLLKGPEQGELITHFEQAKQHWQVLVAHVNDDLIDIAITLDESQKNTFTQAIAEQMDEQLEEFNEQTTQQRREERLKEQLERYEDWLGKLTSAQVELITNANAQFNSTFLLWHSYKQARLDKLKQVFTKSAIDDDKFCKQLAHIILEREAFMSPKLVELDKQNLARYAGLLVALRSTLSDKQINQANEKFAEMIKEIDDLMNN
ncbi:MAG: DUF6279 family lipoprotein [Pseudoalteromonas sp.]